MGEARYSKLSLTLERVSQYAANHWTPRKYTKMTGPLVFVRLICNPLARMHNVYRSCDFRLTSSDNMISM